MNHDSEVFKECAKFQRFKSVLLKDGEKCFRCKEKAELLHYPLSQEAPINLNNLLPYCRNCHGLIKH